MVYSRAMHTKKCRGNDICPGIVSQSKTIAIIRQVLPVPVQAQLLGQGLLPVPVQVLLPVQALAQTQPLEQVLRLFPLTFGSPPTMPS